MVQVNKWANPTKELKTRLENAKKARKDVEFSWDQVDFILYGDSYSGGQGGIATGRDGRTSVFPMAYEDIDNTSSNITITYAFKNLRFIHAQLSMNTPSVAVSPTSSDVEDRRRADAADRAVRYGLRQYKLQEYFDLAGNDALHYGSGVLKTIWNPELGDILSMNADGTAAMSGDFEISVVNPRRIYIDPDADIWDKVRYVFEEKVLPYEEACFLIGEGAEEKLEKFRKKELDDYSGQKKYDVVVLYEYWETGLPLNGYGGRYCICDEQGAPLTEIWANPFAFSRAGSKGNSPKRARLPFHFFTDVDMPARVWGKSFLDFVIRPQDALNRLDSAVLDNLQLHAVFRMVLPEGAEIEDGAITDSPRDIIKMTGTQPPHYMQPPQLTPDMSRYRELLRQGIDDMSGVNESMFGQQSRETAGFAMQYAVNQGSQIRRRLFNKFAMLTESVYKSYLDVIREHWKIPRLITVMGKENSLEAVDLKGADIDGGYDITLAYGTNLAIDPMTRRQEILQYQPLFEKAGVSPRQSLKLMKLNDLSDYYDTIEMADNRQREYFERIIATGDYIEPRPFEDHENMLAYTKQYVMTQEFSALSEELKQLIYAHIKARSKMPAEEAAMLAGGEGAAPAAPVMQPGAMPVELPPEAAAAPSGAMPPVGM